MKCEQASVVNGARAPVINYCLNNVTTEERQRLNALNLVAVEDFCLQRCGDCFAGPFLVVDGKLLTGASHAEILRRLGA